MEAATASPVTVYRDDRLADYAEQVLPVLARDPVVSNVAATIVSERLTGTSPVEPDAWWLRACDATGRTVGAALRTPPYGLLLPAMDETVAWAVADYCATAGLNPPSVSGPQPASTAFAERYAAATGGRHDAGMTQRIYRLDRVQAPTGVAGHLRAATPDLEPLLADWADGFDLDVHGVPGNAARRLRDRIRDGRSVWVWVDDERPVAMNLLSDPMVGVVRVSGVYTPPELRGRRYASALVAATSRHALGQGAAACMLYADLANPVSNHIYQQVGYQPVADSMDWRLGPGTREIKRSSRRARGAGAPHAARSLG